MTVREVEERLEAVRDINSDIQHITVSIYSLRQSLVPSGIKYDKDKVQESKEDKMSGVLSVIDSYCTERDELMTKANKSILSTRQFISLLNNEQYENVLNLWYIGGLKPKEIAEQLRYSIDHIFYLRRKAVKRLSEITES